MTFYRERQIKSVRKARRCTGCSDLIAVGQPALDCSGHYDGDFWSATFHSDCRAAELGLNKLHDTMHDEWMSLDDMEWEDWPWLIEEFPAVAARMNITTEKYEEARAEDERLWRARAELARKSQEKPA